MPGHIRFRNNIQHRIVIAEPHWHIDNEEDCKAWAAEWRQAMSTFSGKIDCVLLLDDFHVTAAIAQVWGKYRAEVVRDVFRFSYRVNQSKNVSLTSKTSSILYDVQSREAISEEGGIEGILEDRRRAGLSN